MAFIVAPAPDRTGPYWKTQYRCTNPRCRCTGWFILPRRRICPRCFAHVEVIDIKRVAPAAGMN